jgi:hypothetical protein
MIVRCIANSGSALPQANIDPRRGYDSATEFPLTIGRDYVVFALTTFLGTAWYYLLDDDGHAWPTWSPSALFDVVDGALPDSWIIGYFRVSTEDQGPLISFPEWAGDRAFYERLVEGEAAAVETFARRRREIEGHS